MAVYSTGKASANSILKVAKALFYENGYSGTKFSQICQTAGVNHGTLVYHFGSKEQIASSIYTEFFSEMLELARQVVGADAPLSKTMTALYILWWDIVCEDKKIARFLREIFQAHITQDASIERIIQGWAVLEEEYGVRMSLMNKRLHAYALVGTDNEIMIHYLPSKITNREIVMYLLSILLSAFQVSEQEIERLYEECRESVDRYPLDFSYFSDFRYFI